MMKFGDVSLTMTNIAPGKPAYTDWRCLSTVLTKQVYLPNTWLQLLSNELADADVSRLHLRLVCRDHDWSLTLADTLEYLWRRHVDTEANVRVYQLAPLDLEDIRARC